MYYWFFLQVISKIMCMIGNWLGNSLPYLHMPLLSPHFFCIIYKRREEVIFRKRTYFNYLL